MGGIDAVEADQVEAGRRNQGDELAEEVERLEDHAGGPITPGALQPEYHATVSTQLQAGARKRRAEDVPCEPLEAFDIAGRNGLLRMQVEPVACALDARLVGVRISSGLPVERNDPLTSAGSQGEDASHTGLVEVSKTRLVFGKRVFALGRVVLPAASFDQDVTNSPTCFRCDVGNLLICGGRKFTKNERAIGLFSQENSVGNQTMKMDVEREMARSTLDDGDGTGHRKGDRPEVEGLLRLPPKELEYGMEEGPENRAGKRGVVGEKVSKRRREAENPVPDRCLAEYVIDQEGRSIVHSSTQTGRTPPTSLTAERDQPVVPALPASDAGKTLGEDSAREEFLELLLDEGRQGPSLFLAKVDEGSVVLLDDSIEIGELRTATLIDGRGVQAKAGGGREHERPRRLRGNALVRASRARRMDEAPGG
jgi:hypothetical protein